MVAAASAAGLSAAKARRCSSTLPPSAARRLSSCLAFQTCASSMALLQRAMAAPSSESMASSETGDARAGREARTSAAAQAPSRSSSASANEVSAHSPPSAGCSLQARRCASTASRVQWTLSGSSLAQAASLASSAAPPASFWPFASASAAGTLLAGHQSGSVPPPDRLGEEAPGCVGVWESEFWAATRDNQRAEAFGVRRPVRGSTATRPDLTQPSPGSSGSSQNVEAKYPRTSAPCRIALCISSM
mmetsp:Transcript_149454/g.461385  ORF Transcript_149454/g.461385 Transcript_149454/m.461385 type:complete len:247 (-) Transcript_149454:571-1311(-)